MTTRRPPSTRTRHPSRSTGRDAGRGGGHRPTGRARGGTRVAGDSSIGSASRSARSTARKRDTAGPPGEGAPAGWEERAAPGRRARRAGVRGVRASATGQLGTGTCSKTARGVNRAPSLTPPPCAGDFSSGCGDRVDDGPPPPCPRAHPPLGPEGAPDGPALDPTSHRRDLVLPRPTDAPGATPPPRPAGRLRTGRGGGAPARGGVERSVSRAEPRGPARCPRPVPLASRRPGPAPSRPRCPPGRSRPWPARAPDAPCAPCCGG